MPNPLPPNYPITEEETLELVKLAQYRIYLPNKNVVKQFLFPGDGYSDAVFPTIRASGGKRQGDAVFDIQENQIGVVDLNHSAQEAIFRSHDMSRNGRSRFTVTHVYGRSQDIDSYTNLANLCLTEKAWAAHTDEDGEVQKYLQYHAKVEYGWEPEQGLAPHDPPYGYQEITDSWQYLPNNEYAFGDIYSFIMTSPSRVYSQFRTIDSYRFSNL